MFLVYVDGSGKGFYVFVAERKGEIFKVGIFRKKGITNNQAEYLAILETLKNFPRGDLIIYSDSLLIVNQLNGVYKIKNEKLKKLAREIRRRMKKRFVEIRWIPRSSNKAGKLLERLLKKRKTIST